MQFCWKFHPLFSSERILKKLLPKVWWLPFFGTQCIVRPEEIPTQLKQWRRYARSWHVLCPATEKNRTWRWDLPV